MNHNNGTDISNAMDQSEAEIVMFKAYLLAYPLYTEIKNTNNYTMKFIIV